MPEPFVLLDDARESGAADARLYREPVEIVVATRPDEVPGALDRLRRLSTRGLHLAGYLTYEAGLALEPRLNALASPPSGAPLLWFGAFAGYQAIPAATVPEWLAANAPAHASGGPVGIGPLEPQISLGEYKAAFATLHRGIEAGDIYQANLTFSLEGPWRGDPLALYAALRPSAAAPYGGIVHDGTTWHLSFSPELFFSAKDGSVRVKPMKGTRPRGRDADEDEALRADLAGSAKDRAENLMIVDLLRNDLSRVSTAGSVRVENPFMVETYPTVHQMVTTIHATRPPNRDAIDLLRALFPCGSITGAPKIRAMELIASVEPALRGVYCGSIGHIEPGHIEPGHVEPGGIEAGGIEASGDAAFNVAIRTLRLTPDNTDAKAGRAVLGVGSAIVADSQVLPEWRECLVKGGFVRESTTTASPAQFDLIETMRFTPEDGIPHLDLHLERVRTSAETLGFNFDRHAVRNAIQALCFDAERPAKLRLVAARSGAYALELAALPEPLPTPATVAVLRLPVDSGDWRLAHKTSDRGFYDRGLTAARAAGAHEALFLRDDGLVTEGCFTNLFVERDGVLLTPEADLGLLPGILRRALLDSGEAREDRLTLDDLAGGFFIGNALRGLIPARLLG